MRFNLSKDIKRGDYLIGDTFSAFEVKRQPVPQPKITKPSRPRSRRSRRCLIQILPRSRSGSTKPRSASPKSQRWCGR